MSDRKALFLSIGCSEKFVDDFLRNTTKSDHLESVILEAGIKTHTGCSEDVGALILEVAVKLTKPAVFARMHRKTVLGYITSGKITSIPQVTAAIDFLKRGAENIPFDQAKFEKECGVGIVVTEKDIIKALKKELEKVKKQLLEERYSFDVMSILRTVRESLPWADGKLLKQKFDEQIEAILGPKTEQDVANAKKKLKGAKAKTVESKVDEKQEKNEEKLSTLEEIMQQFSGRDLPEAKNPAEILEQHNKITGGLLRSRFPPEPNGFLHIGHAKAMNFNFGLATKSGGICFLRFDDTNPSAEEQRFIENIIENVTWLGHKPYDITFSSDYFPLLHGMAVELIKRGKAYVCHQTQAEIKEYRKKKNQQEPSPWRSRSVEENLKEFENMRKGKYSEGEATLRMKIDITSINPCMWDPVAYRIKYEPHPHVKDRWCIYPSYDFTHCLVDSIEHITNSCCTLEFEIRRDSYYWLLAALDLYRPMVWEYSRLNLTHNVLSKRKLKYLVVNNIVRGWDDPRLLTLNGLRRRGFSPEAINDFCNRIGISRTTVGYTKYALLEACARYDMDANAPRTMVVIDPIRVILSNWDEKEYEKIKVADFPKNPERGEHYISLSKVVYIERSDFREADDDKKFFGLAPGKTVLLKYAFNITCENFSKDPVTGLVTEIRARVDRSNKEKVKGNLHWVSGDAITVEVRTFDYLFNAEFPGAKKKEGDEVVEEENDEDEAIDESQPGWLKELNVNSETVHSSAVCDAYLLNCGHNRFQFERTGYFVLDQDSRENKLVFNRTVALKSSKDKE